MNTVDTPYGKVAENTFALCKNIKLLACDVDGVFSDGRIYLGNDGEELKAFHTKDGYGLKALMASGIEVAIITGRKSNIVAQRFTALGVNHIIQGEEQKQTALRNLQQQLQIPPEHTASIGDDIPDTGMFALSALRVAPSDAHPTVIAVSNFATRTAGGFGCVRELCDLILLSQGKLNGIQASSV
ncbi:3-deoxy-manno-octulosonate-8-phosphatase KdsC [Planctobacterium marinum]|uniref:3-deoxy-D-manno-octulosonate 8-phosphate phosphatase KdsC n=1 Tax=Planctobacterium marinum TaxID=1631968 RepID=A0AA48HV87_9ALTE|nr:3-deoxy-D-manno-octulosonate 8-phosphate phosphatase [Planctobacterium marinum]